MSEQVELFGFYGFTDYPTSIVRRELDKYGNRRWVITVDPSSEPVSLKDVKDWGRIDGTLDDDMIANIISSVRKSAELYTGRAFISQTMQMFMDFWPSQKVELIGGPLLSMISVALLTESGTASEYSATNYYVLDQTIPAELCICNGAEMPYNTNRVYAGYRIQYTIGYGSTFSYVPMPIRDAIKYWAVDVYDSRIPSTTPPQKAKEILDTYKIIHLW